MTPTGTAKPCRKFSSHPGEHGLKLLFFLSVIALNNSTPEDFYVKVLMIKIYSEVNKLAVNIEV